MSEIKTTTELGDALAELKRRGWRVPKRVGRKLNRRSGPDVMLRHPNLYDLWPLTQAMRLEADLAAGDPLARKTLGTRKPGIDRPAISRDDLKIGDE